MSMNEARNAARCTANAQTPHFPYHWSEDYHSAVSASTDYDSKASHIWEPSPDLLIDHTRL